MKTRKKHLSKAGVKPSKKASKTNQKKTQKQTRRNKKAVRGEDLQDFIFKVVTDRYTGLEEEILEEKSVTSRINNGNVRFERAIDPSLDYNVSMYSPGDFSAYNVSKLEDAKISEQFDPSQIRVSYKEFPIDMILKRIERKELDLNPDFQRTGSIWNEQAQSRLIESLLIRIPLPVFYIDGSEEDKWIVVDGLQRLSAFKNFALDKKLKLSGLEFLVSLHGKSFDELPRSMQRRILESSIGIYLIEAGTPQLVKLSIFKRINTGGMPLSLQEIRHALYQGQATKLLNEVVESEEFKISTGGTISEERMVDRECVLRGLSFMLNPYQNYISKDLDGFLNKTMETIQELHPVEIEKLKKRFKRSLIANYEIFGKSTFRKKAGSPINKQLFEVWVFCIDQLKDRDLEILSRRKLKVAKNFIKLLSTDEDFMSSITVGTSEVKKVKIRFSRIDKFLKDMLRDKNY